MSVTLWQMTLALQGYTWKKLYIEHVGSE